LLGLVQCKSVIVQNTKEQIILSPQEFRLILCQAGWGQAKKCGLILGINFRSSEKEEFHISYATELLDLALKIQYYNPANGLS